jgi:aspartate-semialdehyde dehydrogenase
VANVGATGVLGEPLARVLAERRFPLRELRAFATQRSAGSLIRCGDHTAVVQAIDADRIDLAPFDGVDTAFFAVGDEVSAAYGRPLAQRGTLVIDKSSAYRLDPDVPLVVPEVNGDSALGKKLIANPNCSTIPLALVLAAIKRHFGLAWASACTYQSVSGAGRDALEELQAQSSGHARVRTLPRKIAGNVIPEIGSFGPDGYCSEERKIISELRKILDAPELPVSATTVRVPVAVGHSEALAFGTVHPAPLHQVEEVVAAAPGVDYAQGPAYATPLEVAGTDRVAVARLRPDHAHPQSWLCWVVSDNLRKGAATNAVQIAEAVLESARTPA